MLFDLPSVPTSAPLAVAVEDVNDSSLTIKWKTPEAIGDSGLDGYTVEYCKDGSELCECTRQCSCTCPLARSQRADRLTGVQVRIGQAGRQRVTGCDCISPGPLLARLVCSDDSGALWNFITKAETHSLMSSLFVNLSLTGNKQVHVLLKISLVHQISDTSVLYKLRWDNLQKSACSSFCWEPSLKVLQAF